MRLRNMATVYILDGNRLLMLYRIGSRVVPPSWCGIGGHFEADELNDPEGCVLRELHEEIGLRPEAIRNLQLRYIALRKRSDEIRQNYYFFAELQDHGFTLPQCDEGILEWVALDDVPNREMPFSAMHCLRHYFETGHADDRRYAGIATADGIDFVAMLDF